MGRIVGIDLGTTNSLVACLDPQTGQPKCIPGPYVSTLCPSVVSLDADGPAAFDEVTVRPGTAGSMAVALRGAGAPPRALVVDFSGLGFGPAAAMLTDDAMAWERAERLKIFGSYDLRTMWTQTAPDSGPVPGVQFNYRLSPLVAACVRLALTRASDASSETNARQ